VESGRFTRFPSKQAAQNCRSYPLIDDSSFGDVDSVPIGTGLTGWQLIAVWPNRVRWAANVAQIHLFLKTDGFLSFCG